MWQRSCHAGTRGTCVATFEIGAADQVMKVACAVIGVAWLCSLVAGQRVGRDDAMSSIMTSPAEFTAQAPSASGEATGGPRVEDDSQVDVLGNEIENAVADYRIDRGGDVYERHSPETAIPKLRSPTS
jgi:hypothetical protein